MSSDMGRFGDVQVSMVEEFVALAEIQRPPHNYFDHSLIASLADAYNALDDDPQCRVIVLASDGKSFCAGADFAAPAGRETRAGSLYEEAVRLFEAKTPVVAAVQGAAIGGGLGLAMSADFRVASPEARFAANFARLGFHHGFGLTVTLPDAVGQQTALHMLLTGRRVPGEEGLRLGLCDQLVPLEQLREASIAYAREIALSGPLAVRSIRETMRGSLAERVRRATDHELEEQNRLRTTDDFKEGVKATAERRTPNFQGK